MDEIIDNIEDTDIPASENDQADVPAADNEYADSLATDDEDTDVPATPAAPVTPPSAPSPDTKWYVLRAVSGKERKVKEYLDKEISIYKWGNVILQVLCPIEKVFKVVAGKKVLREKILFPGYLMLEAVDGKLNDDMVQHIKNVTNVIHFLGKDHPTALRKSEVNKMFGKMDEVSEQGIGLADPYIVGETVKIIDGPFNDFNGTVEEVNDEKKKLKVVVKIFGRATPVELNYTQVEKVA